MKATWKFADAPNTATFTTSFVVDGSPVLRVYHDYDGDWQFHGAADQPSTSDVIQIVGLDCMIGRDASLEELHDLPCGWCATRDAVGSEWVREKNNPFPTYSEDGYYLEDAVWMAQYRNDVHPPSKEIRKNLPVGTYVKLPFRFRAEHAARKDNDTERMWVLITDVDEDEYYVGRLDNDPKYGRAIKCGDTVHFHPLHVMEVLAEDT